jgi:alpha/beta superfamily hydrolase
MEPEMRGKCGVIQFKQEERAVTIAGPEGEGGALEGIFVAGPDPACGGAVVAAPHPLHGGSMDSPVVNELAHACTRAGLASLRFNWRGVGASTGAVTGDAAAAQADFQAALTHLGETVPGALVGCGYSFGACVALGAARREPRVRRLLLVAPPPPLLDPGALRAFEGRILVLVGSLDSFAPTEALGALLAEVPASRLEVIPEADHFFGRGLAEIARVAPEWLRD